MKKALFAYTSKRGHVIKILKFITSKLANYEVDLVDLKQNTQHINLNDYDYVLIASSISYGSYDKAMYKFVNNNADILNVKQSEFLSVNLTARKPEKAIPENSVYIKKFYTKTSWQPKHIEMAAGLLDYPNYGPIDKFSIKLIMTITKGETNTKKSVEYTDWEKLERFAQRIDNI